MTTPINREHLLELVLSGVPDRVLDVVLAASPGDRAEIDAIRSDLAVLAQGPDAVLPSPELRDRLLATVLSPSEPRRALVILDMIQDYLTPGRPLEVPRALAIVPALQRRLAEARRAKMPVVYVVDSHPVDDPDFHEWPVHAVEGTPGADVWPDIAPSSGEVVVRKRTYSAFFGSDFERVLEDLRIDTLVLTGCATEVGLLATATDALMRGFRVEVPRDSHAGANEAGEQVALGVLHVMQPFEPERRRARAAGAR